MNAIVIIILMMFAIALASGGYNGYLTPTFGYGGGVLMLLLIIAAALFFVR